MERTIHAPLASCEDQAALTNAPGPPGPVLTAPPALRERPADLEKLCPGIGRPEAETVCGLEPDSPACQLARLNRRANEPFQKFACGFGAGGLACSNARRRFEVQA